VTVASKGAMLILMLGYTFVFAGAEGAPQGLTLVGKNLRVFLNLNSNSPISTPIENW
jgi:hypothetical protein